jgi:hypothetical protein
VSDADMLQQLNEQTYSNYRKPAGDVEVVDNDETHSQRHGFDICIH